jgi:hypothetical protein
MSVRPRLALAQAVRLANELIAAEFQKPSIFQFSILNIHVLFVARFLNDRQSEAEKTWENVQVRPSPSMLGASMLGASILRFCPS